MVLSFNPFILGLGLICTVLDLTYIGLLIWSRRNPSVLENTAAGIEPRTAGT